MEPKQKKALDKAVGNYAEEADTGELNVGSGYDFDKKLSTVDVDGKFKLPVGGGFGLGGIGKLGSQGDFTLGPNLSFPLGGGWDGGLHGGLTYGDGALGSTFGAEAGGPLGSGYKLDLGLDYQRMGKDWSLSGNSGLKWGDNSLNVSGTYSPNPQQNNVEADYMRKVDWFGKNQNIWVGAGVGGNPTDWGKGDPNVWGGLKLKKEF